MVMARPVIVFLLGLMIFTVTTTGQPKDVDQAGTNVSSSAANKTEDFQGAETCMYDVTITTSFSSPPMTMDTIQLWFRDFWNNEVFVENLNNPRGSWFRRGTKSPFRVYGPCTHHICEVGLRRIGTDGWAPGYVKIYDHKLSYTTEKFEFQLPLSNGIWERRGNCGGASAPTAG